MGIIGKPGGFTPELFEAASSATRDERIDVSICADEVDAVNLAATAAAAAFLLSSSLIFGGEKGITGCENGGLHVG